MDWVRVVKVLRGNELYRIQSKSSFIGQVRRIIQIFSEEVAVYSGQIYVLDKSGFGFHADELEASANTVIEPKIGDLVSIPETKDICRVTKVYPVRVDAVSENGVSYTSQVALSIVDKKTMLDQKCAKMTREANAMLASAHSSMAIASKMFSEIAEMTKVIATLENEKQ